MAQLSADFPFKSQSRLRVIGRWGGRGVVLLERDGAEYMIRLSPGRLAVLAALIVEAKRDAASPESMRGGFRSSRELCELIKLQTQSTDNRLTPESDNLTKLVYWLRKKLGEADLIEQDNLGYRISTAPENIVIAMEGIPPTEPPAPMRYLS